MAFQVANKTAQLAFQIAQVNFKLLNNFANLLKVADHHNTILSHLTKREQTHGKDLP